MYENPVCDFRPLKDNPYLVRVTTGGEKLPYPSDPGYPAATLLEAKILFNRVILTLWFPICLRIYQGLFYLLTHETLQIYQNTFPLDYRRNMHPVKFIIP